MRFGLVHRLMTGALAVLGMAALITSGELGRVSSIALGTLIVVALLIPERIQGHPRARSAGVVLSLCLLVGHSARLFLGEDPLKVAVEFAAGLQIIRVATRRGGAHDQQIVLLALLHLIAGTVLGGGLAYALCFIGFLIAAPGALVLSHLRREVEGNYRQGARDRTGLPVDVPRILRSRRVISGRFLLITSSLAIPIFVFTAVLFVAFPRVGLSMLLRHQGRAGRMVGFSDRVDLGKVGRLRADPTIAMRVYFPDGPGDRPERVPLYLRGTAFDSYDGRAWSRDRRRAPAVRLGDALWAIEPTQVGGELMMIDLEPIEPRVVFLPTGAAAFELLAGPNPQASLIITRGREGDVIYEGPEDQGLRYRVYSGAVSGSVRLSETERARYLALPVEVGEGVKQLARTWTSGVDGERARAAVIERRLREDYTYDLESPSGSADNPLEDFLFRSRRGHCEYYSTAMAMMLRTLGVPSRNVTGFIGGTLNRFGGFYAVRQGDAHSWVEAFVDGLGWVRFDPTPASDATSRSDAGGLFGVFRDLIEAAGERWERHVVGYDLEQQVGLLRSVRRGWSWEGRSPRQWAAESGGWLLVLGAGALGVGAVVLWRRRGRRGAPGRPQLPGAVEGEHAAALYRKLEEALRSMGVPRKLETPPLAHARGLVALGHPSGQEVLELTQVYLAVRFGGRSFSVEERASYKRRVQVLRRATERGREAA